MYELGEREFKYISKRIYDFAKINLPSKKRSLIISRLTKRIRKLDLDGFPAYVEYLKKHDDDKKEFQCMINAISTNYSLFFRESHHLEYLSNSILPEANGKSLNIWSAACSTGQEIYSILITLLEYERLNRCNLSYKLFASDISEDVLRSAVTAVYKNGDIDKVFPGIKRSYFLKGKGTQQGQVKIKNDLVKKIRFFKLNLSDKEYHLPKMDIIFLRNVIIYFDYQTKIELVKRLHSYINPGGYLFLGHSETLSGISEKFKLVGKTVYRRID